MKEKILGIKISPLTRQRMNKFKQSRRGWYSMWVFLILFGISLFGEVIANDKPLMMKFEDQLYFPLVKSYPETVFLGDMGFETEADYKDPLVREEIEAKGWMIWPIIPFSFSTIDYELTKPAPSPPSRRHWLGTDDQGRDVVARILYGFRISVLFGLILVTITTIVGVIAGAVQGYFGGWVDILAQRAIEIWAAMPMLYILIILSASEIIEPGFWTLLLILSIFSWMGLVGVVRAEFLRGRKKEFVLAARALGVSDWKIMMRHILPNAMVAILTLLPFNLSGAVVALTSLDFLGFGMPPGSPSLGELLAQGKANLHAPFLGFSAFATLAVMLVLLVFTGKAARDALDPRIVLKRKKGGETSD